MKNIFLLLAYFVINIIATMYFIEGNFIVGILINATFIIILFRFLKIKKQELLDFKKNFTDYIRKVFIYAFIGMAFMITSNILISILLPGTVSSNDAAVRELITSSIILMSINVAIIVPILEELVFRGLIRKMVTSKVLFLTISTLLFSSIHVLGGAAKWNDLMLLIPYAGVSFMFAYAYLKTNNIYVPISMHILHNSIALLAFLT